MKTFLPIAIESPEIIRRESEIEINNRFHNLMKYEWPYLQNLEGCSYFKALCFGR